MKFAVLLMGSLLLSAQVTAATRVEPELALRMLDEQEAQFKQQVVQVSDNVFTAIGYHGANTSMIVGTDGVIIVDTLMGPESAGNAFEALRRHSDKPVKAIIYTHSHPDHTGGAGVFAGTDNPQVYGADSFGLAIGETSVLQPIVRARGMRQFGRKLSGAESTNRGLAPAVTIDHDRGKAYLPPTITIPDESLKTTIAGVDIEMHVAPGETDDAIFVWLPAEKVLFAGDNFYHTFPNLYAIRGTPYRNVLNWSQSLARMADFPVEHLVPGHTLPISGSEKAITALSDYSAAIRSVFDQTVSGINQGKSPDQIAHEVKLPADLASKPYLIEFYGTVHHAVRAIYTGLLGWFDGNPTTLNPLEPRLEAQKIVALAGGVEQVTKQMLSALSRHDFQWALVLADHLRWLDEADRKRVREAKIQALRGLAAQEYNAPNRNYYLSYANELESGKLSEVWF